MVHLKGQALRKFKAEAKENAAGAKVELAQVKELLAVFDAQFGHGFFADEMADAWNSLHDAQQSLENKVFQFEREAENGPDWNGVPDATRDLVLANMD